MKTFLTLIIALAATLSASAQYYKAPEVGSVYKNITSYGVATYGVGDSSVKFQRAIDEISAAGGGTLYLPKGSYNIVDVHMREGVTMLVEAGSVLRYPASAAGSKRPMFLFGEEQELIHNVVMRGVNGRFTVDLTRVKSGVEPFELRNTHNFLLSDINFEADEAQSYMILFGVSEINDPKIYGPVYSKIRDISLFDADDDYGLIATEAARWTLYERLHSEGGTTLSLDLKDPDINFRQFGGVFDLRATEISNEDGYAAVVLAPHMMQNGRVKIEKISTEDSDYGVVLKAGYLDPKLANEAIVGSFGAGTYVDKVVCRGEVKAAVMNEANYPVDISNVEQ